MTESVSKEPMGAQELRAAIQELYGDERGGQRSLAMAIGKHEVSVSRYITGAARMQPTESILVRLMVRNKQRAEQPALRIASETEICQFD